VDRLKQLRVPATVVALVGSALHFALTLVYFLLAPESFDLLLVDLALTLVNPGLVALLTVLVASCLIPEAVPRARALTVLGLVLTAGLLTAALGLLVAGLIQAEPDARTGMLSVFLGIVPWLTTALIATGVCAALLRRPPVAVNPAVAEAVQPAEPVPAPSADPSLQPGWSPDAAIGAVWRRAGDAAAGAPATGWDATSQPAGWWGPPPSEGPASGATDRPSTPAD
jgi:hypothetical protein